MFDNIRLLSDDDKRIIMNNIILLKKLLLSVDKSKRLSLLQLFIPFCTSLSCMDFIDLLLIAGHTSFSCYRDWPFLFPTEGKQFYRTIECLMNLVNVDSTNYLLLINMFDPIVSGYKAYDRIDKYVFVLLKLHNIIISDEFIVSSKKFVTNENYYKFMSSCIEHNKQLGILPKYELIKHLDFCPHDYHKYDKPIVENLLSNFKNVDPVDVEDLLSIYKKKIREHLITHIDFDVNKLKRYAFASIFEDADVLEAKIKKLKTKNNKSKKRKTITSSDNKSTDPVTPSPDDEYLEKEMIVIDVTGTKISNILYKKDDYCQMSDMFGLNDKVIKIFIPNNFYAHYSSLFYENKFIRVYSRNNKIDILIWNLKDLSKKVNHYHLIKNISEPKIESTYISHNELIHMYGIPFHNVCI